MLPPILGTSTSLNWFFPVRDWHRNRVPLTCEMTQIPFLRMVNFCLASFKCCVHQLFVWIQDWWQISCWKAMNSLNDPNPSIAMKTWVWFLDIFVFFVFESGWNWQIQSSERWTHTNSNRLSGCFSPFQVGILRLFMVFFPSKVLVSHVGLDLPIAWSKVAAKIRGDTGIK